MKFSHKLAVALCASALLPLGVVSIMLVHTQREMLTAHIRESHLALGQSLADELQYTIQHVRRDLTAAGSVINAQPLGENDVLDLLDAYLRENAMVHAVGMYSAEGLLIETLTKNAAVASPLPTSLPSSVLVPVHSSEPDRTPTIRTVWWAASQTSTQTIKQSARDSSTSTVPFIPIVVIVRGNRFSGRLVVLLSSKDVAALLNASALRAFGVERGVIHCMDSDYRLVASTEGGTQNNATLVEAVLRKQFFSRDSSNAANLTLTASQNATYFQSIGAPQEYSNVRGENVIATQTSVPYTNLSVIIEQPLSIVYKPLYDIQTQLVLVCLVVCASAVGIGFTLAAQFMRPLRQLTEANDEMGTQTSHIQPYRKGNDELAFLFAAYNDAVNQLEQYRRLGVNTLLLERNKLEVIMRQTTHGVLVLTPERTIMLVNDMFASYLRQDPVSLEGRNIDEALQEHKQLLGYIDSAFQETAATQEIVCIQDFAFTPLSEFASRTFQMTLSRIMLDRQFVAFVISLVEHE